MDLNEVIKFLGEDDEGKTWLEEKIESAKTGLINKNKELLGKNKKLSLNNETLESQLSEQQESLEELEDAKVKKSTDVEEAVRKTEAKLNRTIEKLTSERDESRGQLSKSLVDGGLKDAIIGANVSSEHVPAVTALLKMNNKIEISTDYDTPTAMVGDKSLSEFVGEWASSDAGKIYIKPADNSGGGTQGSANKRSTGINLADLDPVERLNHARSNAG